MQPVKITIPGKFWDVQIYSGRLFLFLRDGTIDTVDWERLVDSIHLGIEDQLALTCAFKRSDYLYNNDFRLFFQDPGVRELITRRFDTLANQSMIIDRSVFQRFVIKSQSNPYPFPHADCNIYRNRIWVVGMDGVYSGSCSRRNKYPVSTKVDRSWDAPVFSAAASYGVVALCAGSDGLWEYRLDQSYGFHEDETLSQITGSECDACDWMFHSVYGRSIEGGFLASFERGDGPSDSERRLDEVISDETIFDSLGFSWGARDKIYQASQGRLDVVRYSPFRGELLTRIGSYSIAQWKGSIVSGAVTSFGAIAEYDNAIVVIPSTGPAQALAGEPVRWRAYPRSSYYQNHLHVVYEDRLEILSFNHDYFVDQTSKVFGSSALGRRSPARDRPVIQI